MNCERVRDLLSAYLDDQLSAPERQSVTTHLASCADCRGILAEYHHFDALLSQLPRISPSPTLHTKIFTSPRYLKLEFELERGLQRPQVVAEITHNQDISFAILLLLIGFSTLLLLRHQRHHKHTQ
ncbi:anti-sigma factor family protein [Dictyobacter arantiisoli]|uniref:Putative zinc-finger domain-containing protein n=1 Tax=Dictyobacter arantiisoli TaxID=2014874 RepID=A0A5A5T871_9CHLR|nr:zf-HC2 domain-containing protein [Dictyobacter arantiisoli]GCF07602.1 hypothetical protein KDI_11660 [Dictyobacter arantiisoli]